MIQKKALPTPADSAPELAERVTFIDQWWRPVLWSIAFFLLLVSPWLALRCLVASTNPAGSRSFAENPFRPGPMTYPAVKSVKGPWGIIEIRPIIVEPPSSFFGFNYDASPSQQWIISNANPAQARALLAKSGLSGAVIETLMQNARADSSNNCQVIRPPDDIIRAISPEVRAVLYSELGKNPANLFHATPFRFRGHSIHEWFCNSGLSEELIGRIKPLVYKKKQMLCFSDLHLILPTVLSPIERGRLLQALHRAATYNLYLKVDSNASLDAVLAYWGHAGRRYDIEPILKSTFAQGTSSALDVSYLMPGFARTRLYTYINPTRGDPSVRRDCHWTAFNFFNDLPDDRYGRLKDLTSVTMQEYESISSPTQFGDVIFFITPPNAAIHSCVYIADDIVFTKNGVGFGMPFIFEHLNDVVNDYHADFGDFALQYCRRRDLKD